MINHTDLEGRLARPVQINYTGKGMGCARFTIASDRNYTDRNGNTPADFVECEMWGRHGRNGGQPNNRQIEALKQYTDKGSLISIEGSIEPNSYTNKQGIKVYTQPVVAYQYNFLDKKGTAHRGVGGQNPSSSQGRNTNQPQHKVSDPFATASQSNTNSGASSAPKQSSSTTSSTASNSNGSAGSTPNPFADANTSGGGTTTTKGTKGRKIDISDDDLPF